MGKRHEQTLLQRRHPDGQLTHENMLNFTHHQGNINQNHNEIPPVRMANINNSGNNRFWQGCGERGSLLHYGGNPSWSSHSGKQYGGSSKKLKIEIPYDPAMQYQVFIQGIQVCCLKGTHAPPCLQQHYRQQPKYGKSPNVHRWMNGSRRCSVYIEWSVTWQSKRMKSCHLQLRGWNQRVLC